MRGQSSERIGVLQLQQLKARLEERRPPAHRARSGRKQLSRVRQTHTSLPEACGFPTSSRPSASADMAFGERPESGAIPSVFRTIDRRNSVDHEGVARGDSQRRRERAREIEKRATLGRVAGNDRRAPCSELLLDQRARLRRIRGDDRPNRLEIRRRGRVPQTLTRLFPSIFLRLQSRQVRPAPRSPTASLPSNSR